VSIGQTVKWQGAAPEIALLQGLLRNIAQQLTVVHKTVAERH
jgi:hypothetical protein